MIDKIISLCKGKKYDSYKEIKTNADFNDWFNKEDPHKGLTEVEKRTIPKVGTTLNNIFVLPRNCILRILNKEKKRGKIYMTLIVDKVE